MIPQDETKSVAGEEEDSNTLISLLLWNLTEDLKKTKKKNILTHKSYLSVSLQTVYVLNDIR